MISWWIFFLTSLSCLTNLSAASLSLNYFCFFKDILSTIWALTPIFWSSYSSCCLSYSRNFLLLINIVWSVSSSILACFKLFSRCSTFFVSFLMRSSSSLNLLDIRCSSSWCFCCYYSSVLSARLLSSETCSTGVADDEKSRRDTTALFVIKFFIL